MLVQKSLFSTVEEYIQIRFNADLSDSQIKTFFKYIYRAIENDVEFQQINYRFSNNDPEPLIEKINEVASSIVVSSKSIWNPDVYLETERQKLIFNILRGERPSIQELSKDSALIDAVIWKKDLSLLDEARNLIQKLLIDLGRHLCTKKLCKADEFHLEMIMGDLLSLYPFLNPQDQELVVLPAKINDVWCLLAHSTDRIELTPSFMGSPLVAYGLYPSDVLASPILLFKGTTYPTDEGAALSLLTDVNPFCSVGSYAFLVGEDKIFNWLNKLTLSKTIVYGKSLGGALAWHTALHYPDKISKVMAYGAPGFDPLELETLKMVINQHPELEFNFFCQENDPVPFSDCVANEGVNYYQVQSGSSQTNLIAAHADMYSTQERSSIIRMQPESIGSIWKRSLVTVARLTGSLLFPVLGLGICGKVITDTTLDGLKYIFGGEQKEL